MHAGSPARPSNSGDKVRFVLGVILPDSLLIATVLCRNKNSFRDKSAWKHISAGSHALLRFCFVLIGVSGDPQLD